MQPLVTRAFMDGTSLSLIEASQVLLSMHAIAGIISGCSSSLILDVGKPGWPGSPLELPVIQHLLLALIPCAIDRLDAALI